MTCGMFKLFSIYVVFTFILLGLLSLSTAGTGSTITASTVRGRFRCGFEACDYKTDRMYNFKRHMFAVHLKNEKPYIAKKKKINPEITQTLEESAIIFADPLAFP